MFYSKLEREHANTGQYIPRKDLPSSLRDPDCIRNFGIRHYAGTVAYSVMDFVEKNRDDLNQNLQDLIASSSNDFVKSQLFSPAMMSGDPDVAMGIATGASSPVAAAMSPVRQQKGKTQVPAVEGAFFAYGQCSTTLACGGRAESAGG